MSVRVIRASRWSGIAHLPGFKNFPLCELVMICDQYQELAETRAKGFGIPKLTTDYEKMLSRKVVDVVDIGTNVDSHQLLTFAALKENKHLPVEKPACHDYRQTLHSARPDAVEIMLMEIPRHFSPLSYQEGQPWSTVFYSCLIHNFLQEIYDGGTN